MGEAEAEMQQDPLSFIFADVYDHSALGEMKKVKFFHAFYARGQHLKEGCGHLGPASYSSPWQEKQAKRSVVATLQYIGLDTTIKAIGAYARKLEVAEEDYKRLTSNIVRNYCSKNTSVYSLRNIEHSLDHYYKNPEYNIIPSVESSPFASALYKTKTESTEARNREMDYAIRSFRSLCSWGGDVVDYRMMTPFLSNQFLMAFVFRHLSGVRDEFDEVRKKVSPKQSTDTVQVACQDLICRKTTLEDFKARFPLSIGSTGLSSDLFKLYCHHFRFQDYNPGASISEVKKWMKESELEDPILEASFLISLLNGVPDGMMGLEKYKDISVLAKSSIDDRWSKWARDVLNVFSKDLLYEESLKVKARPRRDKIALRTDGFILDFNVTLGELDRVMDETDKLGLQFDLKFSKNYIRYIRIKWENYGKEIDLIGQQNFRTEVANFIEIQLKEKEKLFSQVMWKKDYAKLIADELIAQALTYEGPMFESYRDEVMKVPLKFQFGVFALSYLRYRADVNAGRMKLSL